MSPILSSLYGRTWWSLFLRGVIASVIGIAAIASPTSLLEFIIVLLGILIFVIGMAGTIGGIVLWRSSGRFSPMIVPGAVGIIIGLLTILSPQTTARLIVYLIALWAIVYGFSEVSGAMKLRRELSGEWVQLFVGIIAILFGIVLIIRPITAGALAVAVAGFFLLTLGVFWLVMAIRTKRWQGWSQ